jgi:hypothetical protein
VIKQQSTGVSRMNATMAKTIKIAGILTRINAGERVKAIPASNLPGDVPFKFFVETADGRESAVYADDIALDEPLEFATESEIKFYLMRLRQAYADLGVAAGLHTPMEKHYFDMTRVVDAVIYGDKQLTHWRNFGNI